MKCLKRIFKRKKKIEPIQISKYPQVGDSWALQYKGAFAPKNVNWHILDLWGYDPREIIKKRLAPTGTQFIAYFSMHYEKWRPDADKFDKNWFAGGLDGWKDEYTLKPKYVEKALPIMQKRIDLALEKGYVGIDPDNLDQLWYNSSESNDPRSKEIKQAMTWYWKQLAEYAHKKGLLIGQKNALKYISDLDPDFYMLEQAIEWNTLKYFVETGKSVFNIEYEKEHLEAHESAWVILKDRQEMDAWEVRP